MYQRVSIVKTKAEKPIKGSAGLDCQCVGQAVTVSAVANATGGIGAGNLITNSKK